METWSDSLDFRAIAARHGSPLYLFSEARLERNFERFAAFAGSARNVVYPVKANPHFAVLRRLAARGGSADCASPAEVDLALSAGFPAARIVYNTPAFSVALARQVLEGGGAVVLNARQAVAELRAAGLDGFAGRVFLRWNPGVAEAGEQALAHLLEHGAASSQFGMNSVELIDVLGETGWRIGGIHAHVGSRVNRLDRFEAFMIALHALVDRIGARTGQAIQCVDLGGGLAIDFDGSGDVPSIDQFIEALTPLKRADLVYLVEPGNAMIGDCMGLLATILQIVRTERGRCAILDVGSNELAKITLLGQPQRIIDVAHRPLPLHGDDAVAGPMCFAGDQLLRATALAGLQAGDPLLIQHCGSYCQSLANHFNGRQSPGLVVVRSDGTLAAASTPEPAALNPVYSTYRWDTDSVALARPLPLDTRRFDARAAPAFQLEEAWRTTSTTCVFSVYGDPARSGLGALVDLLLELVRLTVHAVHRVDGRCAYRGFVLSTEARPECFGMPQSVEIALSPWRLGGALIRFDMRGVLSGHGEIAHID